MIFLTSTIGAVIIYWFIWPDKFGRDLAKTIKGFQKEMRKPDVPSEKDGP